jgi:sigma-B regulation protein RsbU (phosphoserine phosphatase)
LDQATHQFSYVRAGHELPLLVDQTGALLPVPEDRSLPLGLFPKPALDTQTVTLQPGDTVLLFSDGVTEAMDGQHEMFELERLTRFLAAHPVASAQALCDQIVEAVAAYRDPAPQWDDITLLAVRALG